MDEHANQFLIIGADQIRMVSWNGENWEEPFPKVSGIGFPTATTSCYKNSVWLELGLNRAAHIQVSGGTITTDLVDLWDSEQKDWITIGHIGTTTILAKGDLPLKFYDESTQKVD